MFYFDELYPKAYSLFLLEIKDQLKLEDKIYLKF
jgi:hypothetical protein